MDKSFKIVKLPVITDDRGALGFAEMGSHVPFVFSRVFYLYNVKGDEKRGEHAHRECQQFLIALRGSFSVKIDDGRNSSIVSLASPAQGLYIPAMHWLDLQDFSADAICLVLASDPYDEADYIRKYSDFKKEAK